MLSGLIRTVDPVLSPLTVSEAKAFLRESTSDNDTAIEGFIASAVANVENRCRISVLPQTWRAGFDRVRDVRADSFSHVIEVPRGPVVSITSVRTRNDDGTWVTLDTDEYVLDSDNRPGRLMFPDGVPESSVITLPSLSVTYVSGYPDAASIPKDIIHALKMLVTHLYENRSPVNERATFEMPGGVEDLLRPYLIHGVA